MRAKADILEQERRCRMPLSSIVIDSDDSDDLEEVQDESDENELAEIELDENELALEKLQKDSTSQNDISIKQDLPVKVESNSVNTKQTEPLESDQQPLKTFKKFTSSQDAIIVNAIREGIPMDSIASFIGRDLLQVKNRFQLLRGNKFLIASACKITKKKRPKKRKIENDKVIFIENDGVIEIL